ncbi:MAG: hypothetical protein FWD80_06100, partial [Propionibacteriaceae bacterium]|nr:hypothetical protein [Propionibacteriaceae bacterium]
PSVQGQPKREMLGDAQWGDWATGDDEKKAARSDAAVLPAGTTLAFPVAYTTLDDTVEYVWFDDFTTFGYPPTEFLIDYKYGYRNPIVDQPWAGASDAQCARWLTEARTKLNVIDQAGGGDLIWEFSDNDVANAVRHYFVANGLDRVIIACVPQI